MNILVIGNGFDLAHGLPTKYGDFLEFVRAVKGIKEQRLLNDFNAIHNEMIYAHNNLSFWIKSEIPKTFGENLSDESIEFLNLIDDNFWLEYFLNCPMYQKENWIDFESEIGRVIKSIDDDMKSNGFDENTVIRELPVPFLSEKFLNDFVLLEEERDMHASEEIRKMEEEEGARWNIGRTSDYLKEYIENHPFENLKEEITYKQLIVRLENDLDKLIRALEIYLAEYVNVINDTEGCKAIQRITPDCVLSFNYSNT